MEEPPLFDAAYIVDVRIVRETPAEKGLGYELGPVSG